MRRQDTIVVQNMTATTGSVGQNVYNTPAGQPVSVDCNAYPLEAEYEAVLGLAKVETRLIVCDSWPGNAHSVLTFEGGTWQQETPPKRYGKTPTARSVQFVISKVG